MQYHTRIPLILRPTAALPRCGPGIRGLLATSHCDILRTNPGHAPVSEFSPLFPQLGPVGPHGRLARQGEGHSTLGGAPPEAYTLGRFPLVNRSSHSGDAAMLRATTHLGCIGAGHCDHAREDSFCARPCGKTRDDDVPGPEQVHKDKWLSGITRRRSWARSGRRPTCRVKRHLRD